MNRTLAITLFAALLPSLALAQEAPVATTPTAPARTHTPSPTDTHAPASS